MKTILVASVFVALTLGLAGYVMAPWPTDSGLISSSQIVNQTPPKCLPGEVMDEKTKKCVKK